MLSERNIRLINAQIEDEIRNVASILTDTDEKDAALERITKLKALLNPQPSREEILEELASIIVEFRQKETNATARLSLAEIFGIRI